MQDLAPSALPLMIDPIGIMKLCGTVQGETDQEAMLGKKLRPTFIDQIPVGLKRKIYFELLMIVYFDKLYKFFIKINTRQGRFPALKGKGTVDIGIAESFPEQILNQLLAEHTLKFLCPVLRNISVETVCTSHIAGRGGRLD